MGGVNGGNMNKYQVGFRWKDGEEQYIIIKSASTPKELAESLKKKDKTGKLETVYVKTL